jgi:shikimate kinase
MFAQPWQGRIFTGRTGAALLIVATGRMPVGGALWRSEQPAHGICRQARVGCLAAAIMGACVIAARIVMVGNCSHSPFWLAPDAEALAAALAQRSVVLVGMMGAGKSSVGRRLAGRFGIPFVDADAEIEEAAGMSIAEIFETHGEAYFRSGEARVIARLLEQGPQVLATGGGAFMNPQTRTRIRDKGISVWLKAEIDVLTRRLRRRNDRPLLKTGDPSDTLANLLATRNPVYGLADITVISRDVNHDVIVDEIVAAVRHQLASGGPKVPGEPPA